MSDFAGNAEQVGDPPDHVIFHLAALTVDIDDLPQHADEIDPLLLAEVPLDIGGEAEEVDRLAFGILTGRDQRIERRIV